MKHAIDLEHLSFRWSRTSPLVLDIEKLEVPWGKRVFIKGPSGSGKSTLLNLIGGVLEPMEGALKVLDHSFESISAHERDRIRGDEMGFVFQTFNLIPYLSVLENVMLPLNFSKVKREKLEEKSISAQEEAERLLKALRLDPAKLATRKVTQLSIGQQQRVACARALMGSPGLVIADEPTSALDFDAREGFLKTLMEECSRNKSTLVFVSHDSSLSGLFDSVIDLVQVNRAYVPMEV